MSEPTLNSIVEAMLFVSDEPITADRLADAAGEGVTVDAIRQAVGELNTEYAAGGRAFAIEEIAGGFQLLTRAEYNKYLRKLVQARNAAKFTQAALESLSIIAYKQPCTRAEIEDIRGVACGDILRTLMEKGLVRISGRSETVGRPLLYGTTKKFLTSFGLSSVKDLPTDKQLLQP
jgi:segregation and condensation protein B